jgi:hypothetical protein
MCQHMFILGDIHPGKDMTDLHLRVALLQLLGSQLVVYSGTTRGLSHPRCPQSLEEWSAQCPPLRRQALGPLFFFERRCLAGLTFHIFCKVIGPDSLTADNLGIPSTQTS